MPPQRPGRPLYAEDPRWVRNLHFLQVGETNGSSIGHWGEHRSGGGGTHGFRTAGDATLGMHIGATIRSSSFLSAPLDQTTSQQGWPAWEAHARRLAMLTPQELQSYRSWTPMPIPWPNVCGCPLCQALREEAMVRDSWSSWFDHWRRYYAYYQQLGEYLQVEACRMLSFDPLPHIAQLGADSERLPFQDFLNANLSSTWISPFAASLPRVEEMVQPQFEQMANARQIQGSQRHDLIARDEGEENEGSIQDILNMLPPEWEY